MERSRRFIKPVCALVLFSLVLASSEARTWTSSELPSPQNDPGGVCGRGKLKSSVCDPDGYISASDADTIDGLINFVNEGSHGFRKLPCKTSERGAQIAVAVVASMSRGFGSKEDRAFQFAKDLHDRWGVGDASCQNGIVLFFAIKDRAMGFSTGSGVKRVFTDAMVPKVMAVMRPKMKNEQYGQAIIDGVTAVGNILSTGEVPEVSTGSDGNGSAAAILFIFLGVFTISQVVNVRKRSRYARCKKLLEKIDKERTAASNNSYISTSCPICLEDFDRDAAEGGDIPPERSTGMGTPSENTRLPASVTTSSAVHTVQAGQGPAAARMTSTDGDAGPPKTLPCGHKFHEKCILSWVAGTGSSNQLCPICRQPITETAAEVEDRTNSGQPSGWDVYDPEYNFRVRRARDFYSDFITWNMINSWEADRYRHNVPMAASAAFTAVDPVVVAAAARASGRGGSSFSFGGGSSAGGGGGGGSW